MPPQVVRQASPLRRMTPTRSGSYGSLLPATTQATPASGLASLGTCRSLSPQLHRHQAGGSPPPPRGGSGGGLPSQGGGAGGAGAQRPACPAKSPASLSPSGAAYRATSPMAPVAFNLGVAGTRQAPWMAATVPMQTRDLQNWDAGTVVEASQAADEEVKRATAGEEHGEASQTRSEKPSPRAPASWAYLSDDKIRDLAAEVLRGLVAPELLRELGRRDLVGLLAANQTRAPSFVAPPADAESSAAGGASAEGGAMVSGGQSPVPSRRKPVRMGTNPSRQDIDIEASARSLSPVGIHRTSLQELGAPIPSRFPARSASPPSWGHSTATPPSGIRGLLGGTIDAPPGDGGTILLPKRVLPAEPTLDATTRHLLMTAASGASESGVVNRRSTSDAQPGSATPVGAQRMSSIAASTAAPTASPGGRVLSPVLRQCRSTERLSATVPGARTKAWASASGPGTPGLSHRPPLPSGVQTPTMVERRGSVGVSLAASSGPPLIVAPAFVEVTKATDARSPSPVVRQHFTISTAEPAAVVEPNHERTWTKRFSLKSTRSSRQDAALSPLGRPIPRSPGGPRSGSSSTLRSRTGGAGGDGGHHASPWRSTSARDAASAQAEDDASQHPALPQYLASEKETDRGDELSKTVSAADIAAKPGTAELPRSGSQRLDSVLAAKLAAADRELALAQSAASRLAAVNHKILAAQGAAVDGFHDGIASLLAPKPGEPPLGSQEYEQMLAAKMRDIEDLQRRTEENITRLSVSRQGNQAAAVMTTSSSTWAGEVSPPEAAERRAAERRQRRAATGGRSWSPEARGNNAKPWNNCHTVQEEDEEEMATGLYAEMGGIGDRVDGVLTETGTPEASLGSYLSRSCDTSE